MVKALQPHVKLTMNVKSEAMMADARAFLAADQIDVAGIDFVIDPNTHYFIRAYAVFVKDAVDKLHVVDFVYSNFGRFPPLTKPPMSESDKKFWRMGTTPGRNAAPAAGEK